MRALLAVALVLGACGQGAEGPAVPTAAPLVEDQTVSVPAAPAADWRLWIRDSVLLATPPGLGLGAATPGGVPGMREVMVRTDDGSPTALYVRIWHGPAQDTIRHLTSKSETTGRLRLGSRTATEITFTAGERSVVFELADRIVVEITGPSGAIDDRALAIIALAAPMLDTDATFSAEELAAALGAAVALTDPRVPDAPLSQGKTVTYRAGGSEREFAMAMTFPDRRSRLAEDPNEGGGFGATVSWIAPIAYRGLGNAAVVIGSADAAVRYRALLALDGLASRGREPPCVEEPREVFRSLIGALGVSGFNRMQERLASDAQVAIADSRGVLGSSGGLRGRAMSSYFAAAARAPLIGSTALRSGDLVVSGARLATPAGTRASSRDGETDIAVAAQAGCERGLVRFSDLSITVGTPAAHPCPDLARKDLLMSKGIPVNTATKADVDRLLERDATAIRALEDIAGMREDPNPLRDPRVPRCAIGQLRFGDPAFARRYPSTAGTWLVPVRFGEITLLTLRVSRDESGLGLVGGSQGGETPLFGEAEARRRTATSGDPVHSLELVYAKPRGPGPDDQLAWRAVRSSGAIAYFFPSYPGEPDGLILSESEVTFPPQ